MLWFHFLRCLAAFWNFLLALQTFLHVQRVQSHSETHPVGDIKTWQCKTVMRRKGTGLTAQGKYTVSHLASNAAMATASQPWASPTQSWVKRLYLKEETAWLNSEVWHVDWDNSELDIYTKPPSILSNWGASSAFPMSLWKSPCPLSPLLCKTSSTCELNIYHLEMKWLEQHSQPQPVLGFKNELQSMWGPREATSVTACYSPRIEASGPHRRFWVHPKAQLIP